MCSRVLNVFCACVSPSQYRAAQTRPEMRTCVGLPGGTNRMAMPSEDGAILWKPGGLLLVAVCGCVLCEGQGPVSFAPANVPRRPTAGPVSGNPAPKASSNRGLSLPCLHWGSRSCEGGLCSEHGRGPVLCGWTSRATPTCRRVPSWEPVPTPESDAPGCGLSQPRLQRGAGWGHLAQEICTQGIARTLDVAFGVLRFGVLHMFHHVYMYMYMNTHNTNGNGL